MGILVGLSRHIDRRAFLMKNTMRRILILGIIVTIFFSAQARTNYTFRNSNIRDGLPDNQIKSLFLSSDGRLGIRTAALLTFDNGGSYSSYSLNVHLEGNYTWGGYRKNRTYKEYVDTYERIWLKDLNYLRVFDLKGECFVNTVDSLLKVMHIDRKLQDFFMDKEKRYWFILQDGSVCSYSDTTKELQQVCDSNILNTYGYICDIDACGDTCWMVHESGVIRCWDAGKKKFLHQSHMLQGRFQASEYVTISVLPEGKLWLKWKDGVVLYDSGKQECLEVEGLHSNSSNILTDMIVDNEGNVWISSSKNGLYLIDRTGRTFTHIRDIQLITGGCINNDILSIVADPTSQSMWLGLLNQGICYYHPSLKKFSTINKQMVKGNWKNENVRSMVMYNDKNILLGTEAGLYRYNLETFYIDVPFQQLKDKICREMMKDSKGRVWIGTFRNGLYYIKDGILNQCNLIYRSRADADLKLIRCLFEDSKGRIWVGIYDGLCLLDPVNFELTLIGDKHPQLKKIITPTTVTEDKDGNLIVGNENGLYYYHPDKEWAWAPEVDAPADERFHHTNNKYNCIYYDSRGMTWFGTHNGLNVLEADQKTLRKIEADVGGISNNIITYIQEDQNQDIWFSTTNGLNKVMVVQEEGVYRYIINTFNSNDGLINDEYNSSSGFKAWDGTLYFGGMNGFSAFLPENIVYNNSDNTPIFTSLKVFYSSISPRSIYHERELLPHNLNDIQEIELEYNENYVTLEFAGLNYVNPFKTYYKYKMEGVDSQWQEVKSSEGLGRVTYSSLRPGKYVFQVYTANSDHVWGKQSAKLTFIVKEPYWNTTLARVLYLLMCLFILGVLIVYLNRKEQLKLQKNRRIEKEKQYEEMNQMKFRFFTNVSHEFRTPLTLIITPLGLIINEVDDEKLKKKLVSIYRNAQGLLKLVNQLLDFRKLEMKGEKLTLVYGEITQYVHQLYANFQSITTEKKINFKIELPLQPVYMYFDQDKIYKIINNLLSNAYKFTPEGGEINIRLCEEENDLLLEISDSGVGIPVENLPYIFERFYQVSSECLDNTGSGIGLHLVKEYVNLLQGKIEVMSIPNVGTTFSILIPTILHPQKTEKEECRDTDKGISVQPSATKKFTILLVEDNEEFRTFMKEQLDYSYWIIEAKNGSEGEKLAIERNPDLIVSDVMMPIMDGMTLCERIKTNIQTSHIPVILLTARTSDEDKTHGYKVGADSYITKPFSFNMLLTRILKLIELQEKRKQSFHKNIEVAPSSITITSLDQKMVHKVLCCVERNMDNPEFSVEQLASDIGMTRMSLYRKLQSLTGQSPVEFIRSIRLKRAAQLLKDTDLSIKEIADMTGFNATRYFTKCFKEMFDVLPSEYSSTRKR